MGWPWEQPGMISPCQPGDLNGYMRGNQQQQWRQHGRAADLYRVAPANTVRKSAAFQGKA